MVLNFTGVVVPIALVVLFPFILCLYAFILPFEPLIRPLETHPTNNALKASVSDFQVTAFVERETV